MILLVQITIWLTQIEKSRREKFWIARVAKAYTMLV